MEEQVIQIHPLEGIDRDEYLQFVGEAFIHKTGYTSVTDFLQNQYYAKVNITQNKVLKKISGAVDFSNYPEEYDKFISKTIPSILPPTEAQQILESIDPDYLEKRFEEGVSILTRKFYFNLKNNPITKKVTLYCKLNKNGNDLYGQFLAIDEDNINTAQSHIAHTHLNLRDVARFVPGAIVVYKADPENEEILYANDEAVRLFDCESFDEFMELVHRSFKGMVHQDDYERTEETIWHHINHNSQQYDYVSYRIITKKGIIKEVNDIGHLVDNFDIGPLFYVFLYDQGTQMNVLRDSYMADD